MLDLKIINGNCYINGKLEKQDIGIKEGKIVKCMITNVSQDVLCGYAV